MEIELWSGTTKAIIDPQGAWLTNFSDENGDILFPKRTLKNAVGEAKVRGGCHVCLPNFGPGGASSQPQHGFGREMTWHVQEKTDNSAVFVLENGRGDYERLHSTLRYELGDSQLKMTLITKNNGKKTLRMAPAFHPYFAVLAGGEVKINGENQPLDDIAEVQFMTEKPRELQADGRTFTLRSHGLPAWAKWTDQLGPYVCVEPSVGGFTFLNEQPGEEELLRTDEHKTYALEITWK